MNSQEPLLTNSSNKYTIFPIQYHDIWEMYLTHKKAVWFVDEIDMSHDSKDWKNCSVEEQHFIKYVLAFFAASDGIVMENLSQRFCNDIQIAEARMFYTIQMFMESEHSLTYSRLIETYVKNPEEKLKLFNAIETMPVIQLKSKWAEKWINSSDSFAIRLVAFAAVEGIFFSGSFCCIYWLEERGILQGLTHSNKFISRDEGLHTDFACLLYTRYINEKLTQQTISTIIKEAVEIEKQFITEALPCSLLGMNSELMKEYIEFVANRLVKQLGHTEIYAQTRNPFSFMDRIALKNKANFFEGRVSEYQKNVVSDNSELGIVNGKLIFTEDF